MNTATAITIGAIATLIPTVTCIIAYLFSRQDVRDLRAEFRARLGEQDSKINGQDSKLDPLSAKLDGLKESSHRDALEIMRTMVALHERVAVVEAKQARRLTRPVVQPSW